MAAWIETPADYSAIVSKALVAEILWLQGSTDLSSTAAGAGATGRSERAARSLLDLRGLGREIWAGESADAYVRRLREEW
jgi:hypothetical protein